ncbi:MAG TPA: MerR family DNA-binding transcriptional regulator [Planctomycetaceae bacterium]|nr:MerR family DNA-binding transcriptional regulator [Planctomycetaceae bacterium]
MPTSDELDEYEYIRINKAAKYLGVCRNTLRNWGQTGKIPEHRHPVNNYRLFKVSDLEKLLAETEASTTKRSNKPR